VETKKNRRKPPGAKDIPRIRWRNQGGALRAYAELRDLGGGQPALIPPGEKRATTDPDVAEALLLRRLAELTKHRRNRVLLGVNPEADLTEFAVHHLRAKAESGEYDDQWLDTLETYLARAVAFFTRYQHARPHNREPVGMPRNLATISVPDIRAYDDWLKKEPNGRGGFLGPQSRRHHLNALSGVFRRAISEGVLPMGSNPVAALLEKPTAPKSQTAWLEVDELALLLESARTLVSAQVAGGPLVLPCAYELLATFILTGAREGEIRRLQLSDLDFDSQTINIPGTKTEASNRTMPMHPQLREILLPYVQRLGLSSGYLFATGSGEPIRDWRSVLDTIAVRAGFPKGHVRTRVFRTSYITHRLACTDHGAPIDAYQVAREVGHSSLAMIMRVYGRVQRRRVRMEELAFRTDAVGSHLAARLEALYLPIVERERSRAKGESELIGQFLAAIAGMAPEDVAAATGIPRPTVNRLRAGYQRGLQVKTRTRIEEFLQAA
jgi:integrase